MSKVLIFGASGLIGHTLLAALSKEFEVVGTLRKSKGEYENSFFERHSIIDNIDIRNISVVESIVEQLKPDYIINATGITKRKTSIYTHSDIIYINSLFPHLLCQLSSKTKSKVVQLSTDCVFSGAKGKYFDSDFTDARDIYGRTKALGDLVGYERAITIRSSFIGFELFDKTELLEWFVNCNDPIIKGFDQCYYSGITSLQLAKSISKMIEKSTFQTGLYHLVNKEIVDKKTLLEHINSSLDLNKKIVRDSTLSLDRSLLPSNQATNIFGQIPGWPTMLNELKEFNEKL
jgi:dTDP-4-dehydrorhamnose reductase